KAGVAQWYGLSFGARDSKPDSTEVPPCLLVPCALNLTWDKCSAAGVV
ncbi:hypothetical protein AVEN_202176-1, partial [Araneus ventricosus]